ncbi:MAG: transcription termination factor Rho [Candidatus Eisenbacteria sp.]|nr:transcription termination factor Rho [Candidatus Eisenbacteria bacterium]
MSTHYTGVLQRSARGRWQLRDPKRSFRPGPDDVLVPPGLIAKADLMPGATVTGRVRENRGRRELADVESVCGLSPDEFRSRKRFRDLVAIDPEERFPLGAGGEMTLRIIDLLAPIGRGSRCLVVSPAKAGKTTILEQIGRSIHEQQPDVRLLALLVDERPEEVTHFRRAVPAEVLASSNDQSYEEHVALAETTLACIQTELECGRNIVLLVDSLTRMGRAFNLKGSGTGRTMSGGLEAGALEIPRRFFGLARNVEHGGSVTIIATILVDTGSRMDQLIFEEFKGTGNSEIVLDRALAEARIFPALHISRSGTRKEERLYPPEIIQRLAKLRRVLSERKPETAMRSLITSLANYSTNEEFLKTIPIG